jgi:hypothetical protein
MDRLKAGVSALGAGCALTGFFLLLRPNLSIIILTYYFPIVIIALSIPMYLLKRSGSKLARLVDIFALIGFAMVGYTLFLAIAGA